MEVAPSAEKVVASEYARASLRSVNKCNTTRKTYLLSGYTTAPANTEPYNHCWLVYESKAVRKYNPGTYALQKNGLNSYADGYFGNATLAALKSRQKAYGLTQDGIYGWNTGRTITWKNQKGDWYRWS